MKKKRDWDFSFKKYYNLQQIVRWDNSPEAAPPHQGGRTSALGEAAVVHSFGMARQRPTATTGEAKGLKIRSTILAQTQSAASGTHLSNGCK